MRSVPRGSLFLDTAAIIALEDVNDQNHTAAAAFVSRTPRERLSLVTTNFILDEAYTWFCGHYEARIRVAEALIHSPRVTYERLVAADELEALALGRRLKDKDFSFTDLTSFVFMERTGLRRVFTFDRHFRQYGRFEVVP